MRSLAETCDFCFSATEQRERVLCRVLRISQEDRSLNTSIARKPFCILTIKQLLEFVQLGDWFTTIDLKDAYFHTEVAPKHAKFVLLRDSIQIQQAPVQLVTSSLHLQHVCGSSVATTVRQRHEGLSSI